MGDGVIYSKQTIVTFIDAGSEFVVPSGEKVRVVKFGSEKFLRSVANDSPEDNLGELPLFEHRP